MPAILAGLAIVVSLPAGAGSLGGYRHLVLDGHVLKWGTPVVGTGAAVTYALVEADTRFPGARNCAAIGPVSAILRQNAIGAPEFRRELVAALRTWERVADITFAPASPETADILIGAQLEPRGYAFANVEYDRAAAGPGPRTLTRSTVCLNPARAWKIGFDGDLEVYDLRYTLIHEIGHAIGLDHPTIDGQLMAYTYGETFRSPQAGDISGAVALYGAPQAVRTVRRNDGILRAAQ